uniref:hypothetical protein n=1 Tax=Trichocoleus desertorum TaxID=1481672 RepID=UPI0025B550BD|nr:hypothetical protein [Trichocoleus desertorum]
MPVDVLVMAREAKLIRSGLPLKELVERSKLIEQLERQLGGVKTDAIKAGEVAKQANTEAKKATESANIYKREFERAKTQIGRDFNKFKGDVDRVTKPLQEGYKKIDNGVQRLTKGLDKFGAAAGIGFGLAGVVISFAALWTSERNQAAFDKQIDRFQVDMTAQGGFNLRIQNRVKKLREEFDAYKKKSEKTFDYISQDLKLARRIADAAKKQANDITYEARTRLKKLNDLVAQANSNVTKALKQDTTIQQSVSKLQTTVKTVDANVKKVEVKATKAESEATQARNGVKLVDSKATTALTASQQLPAKIPSIVQNQIAPLKTQVLAAETTAKKAIAENPPQNQRITALENKVQAIQNAPKTNTPTTNQPGTNTPTVNQAEINRAVNNSIAGFGILPRLTAAQATADAALARSTAALNKPELDPIGRSALALGTNNAAAIDKLNRDIQALKAPNLLEPRLTTIETKVRERERVDAAANQKLDQLVADRSKLDLMLTGLGGLALMAPAIINNLGPKIDGIPDKAANAVASAPCNARGCGGKTSAKVDGLSEQVSGLSSKLDKFNAGANLGQLALLTRIDSTTQGITNKLGAPIPGGIGGLLQKFSNSFEKFAEWAHLDRVLNILTLTATVHNAYMLSNGLSQTFFSMVSNVLAAVGIKDKENNPLDINKIVGTSIENLFKQMLGVATVDGIKAEWKKYNRILQSASNLLWSFQSIGYSILGSLEIIANWNALVANALKKFGVVGERAYKWFNPEVNFQNRFFTAIDKAENFVSNIDQVAQETLSIQETITQIGKQKKELADSVAQLDNSPQRPQVPEAAKVAASSATEKATSASPTITVTDQVKAEV